MSYNQILEGSFLESDWICLMTSSESKPELDKFNRFTRAAIKSGVLEFKGHGKDELANYLSRFEQGWLPKN